jgi:hypothetical protein
MIAGISAELSSVSAEARQPVLYFPEKVLIWMIVVIAAVSLAISVAYGQAVAWDRFSISFVPSVLMLMLGIFVRLKKDMPRLADLAVGSAIYIGFSGVIAIFIYLRFPISVPLIDDRLMAIDGILGYSWPDFVTALAGYPLLGKLLSYVYLSSLLQIFLIIAILALMGRAVQLHRAMLTGTISLLLCVVFWWALPSFGPSAYFQIAPEVEASLNLVVNGAYGAEMVRLANEGVAVISPEIILGTIAFPSYHTVMACLVVWFLIGTPLFAPAVILNVLMIPAILSHGGHHLVDVIGGLVVFAVAVLIAQRLAPHPTANRA